MKKESANRTKWFTQDRFGIFIHWGLYSLAAQQEWVKSLEMIDDAQSDKRYFEQDLYNPKICSECQI